MTTALNRPDVAADATPGTVPFADCWISPQARRAAQEVLTSGWVTTGPRVQAFETEFARTVGARHAVAVSSCTAGLELSLRALQLPPGAPVLVSTFTFCGAVQAILHAGLRPVLVDVDPATGMPTEATTSAAARACGGAAAMMVVHWAGDPADVPALAAAACVPGSRVVVDAAHALGATWHGRPIGSGAAVNFSFYATKNLPIGEGGMVTTDDPDTAAWLRRARLHGMSADAWRRYLPGGSWRYDVPEAGLKANLTDLQAAIGLGQLGWLPRWQRRREELAATYDELLEPLEGVGLPHRPAPSTGQHAWHLYPIRVLPSSGTTRDAVAAHLAARGIGTSVHFTPVHLLSYFRSAVVVPPGGLPGADTLFAQELSLPLYPRLGTPSVTRVAAAVADAVHGHRREAV
ncbi:MAG TPA: DegT/DnrJ/EryC1/StrS aminotransferase family protein [Marmoricola sp.]|nr:DegT/DnrJ/EryC1/StrS aminotransferase family protein [Marmoricola sp.]